MSDLTSDRTSHGRYDPRIERALSALSWLVPIGFLAAITLYPLSQLFAVLATGGSAPWHLLFSERLSKVFLNTLQYTVLTTVWALIISLPLAWVLSRSDDRLSATARGLIMLGFVLPEFIYAIAYVFVLDPNTGYLIRLLKLVLDEVTLPLYGLAGMSLITGFFCVPQIVILVEPALRNISSDLEEAAEVGGAGTWRTLRGVILPLALPAVLTATLLTFLLAFASFGIPAALGVPVNFFVLSTEVYSVISAYPPRFDEAAMLSVVFIAVSLLVASGQILATRHALRYRTMGGKGFRRRRPRRAIAVNALRVLYIWTMAAVVSLVPLCIVFAAAFAERWWNIPGAMTLKHFLFVLGEDPLLADVALTTVSVTLITVAATLVLAIIIARFTAEGRRGFSWWAARLLGYVALSVPPIAFTIGALVAYVKPPLALYGTIWILIVTYCARFYPLAAGPIADGFGQLDPGISESALVGGAGAWRTFWQIQLPLIRPAVIAAALVVMMFTMRELLSAVFLQSSQVKMAMVAVFNYWEEGNLERAAAMSTVIVLVSIVAFVIATRLQRGAAWRHAH